MKTQITTSATELRPDHLRASRQLATDEAIDWISSHNASQNEVPFFLYLAFHEPHEPVASPKELVDSYEPVSANRDEAQFFANVANVDKAVGKLVKKLDELKLRDNTLIIFTSDNGPETLKRYSRAFRSYGRPTPLRGMKLWTTEAGFRVAGIMNWPAAVKPSQTGDNSQVVSSLDFLPTFAKLAEAKLPEDLKLDGTDISPVFRGHEIQRDKPLVWAYYNAINERRVAMRHGNWKVLAKLGNGSLPKTVNVFDGNREQVFSSKLTDFEFYDIEKDISEANANAESGITQKLENLLRKEYEQLKSDSHVWTKDQN